MSQGFFNHKGRTSSLKWLIQKRKEEGEEGGGEEEKEGRKEKRKGGRKEGRKEGERENILVDITQKSRMLDLQA